VKTCVGREFCRFGLGDSTRLGIDIERRYQGLESPAKIKLAVSGCPRNCAESYVKDVGIVAVEGGRWEIYIGGAAGATVRKGDLLASVDSRKDAVTLTGRFIQYYRENARWLERTYDFVPRVGLAELQAILVDDRDGIADRLDEAVQDSIDAYRDPWQERANPVTDGQFRTAVPLIEVPVL
jgi:nitrite reductase (NADH) large subunit